MAPDYGSLWRTAWIDLMLSLWLFVKGDYAGFCEEQPTCAAGGKPKVVGDLKAKHGYKNVVMIGDGATDLEACPPAVREMGYQTGQETRWGGGCKKRSLDGRRKKEKVN